MKKHNDFAARFFRPVAIMILAWLICGPMPAQQAYELNANGTSHLHWPYRSTSWADRSFNEGGLTLTWGVLASNTSPNHHGGDKLAQDWYLCDNAPTPNCEQDCGRDFLAPVSGTVLFAGNGNHGFGNEVIIQCYLDNNFAFRISHMQAVEQSILDRFNNGETVGISVGQLLGQIGQSDDQPTCHVHAVLYKNIYENHNHGGNNIDQAIDWLSDGNSLCNPTCGAGNTSGNQTAEDDFAALFAFDAIQPPAINVRLPYYFGTQVRVGSGYNTSGSDAHSGLDASALDFEPLGNITNGKGMYAPVSGTVTSISGGSSKTVKIRPDYLPFNNQANYTLWLRYLKDLNISNGQYVSQGQYIGRTVNGDGSVHMHIEGVFASEQFSVSFSGSSRLEDQVLPNSGESNQYDGITLTSSNAWTPPNTIDDYRVKGGDLNGTTYIIANNTIYTNAGSSVVQPAGATAILEAGIDITLRNGFDATGNFTARISNGGSGSTIENGPINDAQVIAGSINESSQIDQASDEGLPQAFVINQNYPNPFNPETTIEYALKNATEVRIVIYNINGQQVRVLVDEQQSAGYRKAIWNGNDDSGNAVASGIYFYRITTPEFTATHKMILAR